MKNFSEVEWNWERQPEEGEHAITCNVGFKNPETGLSDETSFDRVGGMSMANGKAEGLSLATPKITYPGATREAEKGGKKDV